LNWENWTSNGESDQLLIYGKGDKTPVVLLPNQLYVEILKIRLKLSQFQALGQEMWIF
jgi:hypothetical protein